MTGLMSLISFCVLTGALRRVRLRIWSLKCWCGFLARKRVARPSANPALDLRSVQPHRPPALLDLVPEELEPVPSTYASPVSRATCRTISDRFMRPSPPAWPYQRAVSFTASACSAEPDPATALSFSCRLASIDSSNDPPCRPPRVRRQPRR